jgi:hypothetical protein
MNQPSNVPNPASDPTLATEHDLLASILNLEPAYPWQPMTPGAEPYLASLEAEFDTLDDGELTPAIAAGWQNFAAQMTTQMAALAQPPVPSIAVLEQISQFQARVPGGLLQNLATAATTLARSGQPLIDQLVQCVNEVLPAWNADDLSVLARPLAYSLRDGRGEILELNLRAIPTTAWETLSDLEQVRLTLAIASMALKAAQAESDPGADGDLA